jgi:lysine biosynthesis protein LysW
MRTTNPITGSEFEIPEGTGLSEIVTDPDDGSMFEVVSIEGENATLEEVNIQEDWGE